MAEKDGKRNCALVNRAPVVALCVIRDVVTHVGSLLFACGADLAKF
jgi:hypothetical protein